jgi:hypothetical protein
VLELNEILADILTEFVDDVDPLTLLLADCIGEELYEADLDIDTVGERVGCREGDSKVLPLTYALCEILADIEACKDETGELVSDTIGETDCV